MKERVGRELQNKQSICSWFFVPIFWVLLPQDSSQKRPTNDLILFTSNKDSSPEAGLWLKAIPSEYKDTAHCLNRSSAFI